MSRALWLCLFVNVELGVIAAGGSWQSTREMELTFLNNLLRLSSAGNQRLQGSSMTLLPCFCLLAIVSHNFHQFEHHF